MTKQQLEFDRFYQRFFYTYLERRPVNASFLGRHEFDDKLPDYSKEAVQKTMAEIDSQLAECTAMSENGLTSRQKMDKKLIEGFLKTQQWEFSSKFFYKGNPSHYTGEAIFGMLCCILSDYAPAHIRFESMAARMQQFPQFFQQAIENIHTAPKSWTERAIRECNAGIEFIKKGLPRAKEENNISSAKLDAASVTAIQALEKYLEHLKSNCCADDEVACGREAYRMYLDYAHFTNVDIDEQLAYAEDVVEKETSYLTENAKKFGAATPQEVLAQLADFHPSPENYLKHFEEVWNEVKALSDKYDLVTWPEFPIEYINMYDWAKECAPSLYFLFYRAPAAFNRPVIHKYLVPALRINELTEQQIEAFLRANNNEVIKDNHVVHHGSIGHHIQNWNAYHQQNSLIGQFAGCDGASRPMMPCSATLIEGWAVYTTSLVGEYGFHTLLEEYAEHYARRRSAARTVVDIKLHCGEFTLEEAAQYYNEKAGMSPEASKAEAVKNSMFPSQAFAYLFGSDAVYRFREEVKTFKGDKFSIREFHDDYLSYGSIPVTLIEQDLKKKYGML